MKKNGLFLISLLVLILSLGVLSCEVGLGAQVDTVAPTVKINTPPSSAVIRDQFAIGGKWDDDGSISNISVTLKRISGDFDEVHTFKGVQDGKNWSAVIDPIKTVSSSENGETKVTKVTNITDGEYEATVVFEDNGGHVTTASRSFIIDNTPPVVLLTRPASTAIAESKDTFGRKIVFEGKGADNNKITRILVDFYNKDESGNYNLIPDSSVDKKITQDTFGFLINHADADGKSGYNTIYGNEITDNTNETRTKYYTFKAYDRAQRYPVDGKRSEEDELGNCAETFYLASDNNVSAVLEKYMLPQLYEMKAGIYQKVNNIPSADRTAKDAPITSFEDVINTLNTSMVDRGGFKLNPRNNPQYKLSGRDPVDESTDWSQAKYAINNAESTKLSIEITAGIDNTYIDDFYVAAVNKTDLNKEIKIEGPAIEKEPSGPNWVVNITPSKVEQLKTGNDYYIKVVGTDRNKRSIVPYAGTGYGFRYNEANTSANISVTSKQVITKSGTERPAIGKNYIVKNTDILKVNATKSHSVKNDYIGITVKFDGKEYYWGKDAKIKNRTLSKEIAVDSNNVVFSTVVDTTQDEGAALDVVFVIHIYNDQGTQLQEISDKTTVLVDNAAPSLAVLQPGEGDALGSQIDNKITINGTVTDYGSGVKNIKYIISQNNKTSEEFVIDRSESTGASWFEEIDLSNVKIGTGAIKDTKITEGLLSIVVKATDKLDNEITYKNGNQSVINFYFDKKDPTITINAKAQTNGVNQDGKVIQKYAREPIEFFGTIEDTDGLKDGCLEIVLSNGDKAVPIEPNSLKVSKVTDKKYSWTFDVKPQNTKEYLGQELSDGEYTVSVQATDITTIKKSKKQELTVILDTKNPVGNASLIDNKTWYKGTQVEVGLDGVSDDGSGLSAVLVQNGNLESTGVGKYKGFSILKEGKNQTITFDIIDNAGNKYSPKLEGINVDLTPPTATLVSVDGTKNITDKLINGTKGLNIVITPKDTASGIDKVELTKICGKPYTDKTGVTITKLTDSENYEIKISEDVLKNMSGSGFVSFKIVDGAGNAYDFDAFNLTIDTEAPIATIGTIADADVTTSETDVNETIVIEGTLKDNNGKISSATLQYYADNKWNDCPSLGESKPLNEQEFNWKYSVDTTKLATGECKFRVIATDEAGNSISEEAIPSVTVNVNQDSDRPIITLTTLENTGTSTDSVKMAGSSTIYGKISDDDSITKLEYSIKQNEWKPISPITNGGWELELPDNDYDISFRVTEDEAGTKVWTSGLEKLPKLKGKNKESAISSNGILYLMVDTKMPEVTNVKFATEEKIINDAENLTFDYYNKAKNQFTTGTSKPGMLSNSFDELKLTFTATDDNGLKSVSAILDCNDGTPREATVSKSGNDYTLNVSIPQNLKSGEYSLTYTVVDKAGMKNEKIIQVSVDNTAPIAKVLGPKSTDQLSGNVNVFGNMDSNGLVYYGISKSSETEPANDKYFRIKDAGLSWSVFFDGDTNPELTSAHGSQLNQYLIDLYNSDDKTYGDITKENIDNGTYDKLTPLYIWIKAVDDAGNVNSKYSYKLTVDPQGDRPTVTLSSPTQGDTVGGLVTFYGTSLDLVGLKEDTIGVDSIWGQFISGYNPVKQDVEGEIKPEVFEITADQLNALKDITGSDGTSKPYANKIVNMKTGKAWDGTDTTNAKDYGIKLVDATKLTGASWSCRINEKSEFNPTGDATTNNVGVQFFAKDKDGKLSKGVASYVKVDADAPIFDETYITIVDKENNTRSIPYSDGMYISAESTDKIYLDGVISDNFRLANIYIGGDNVTAHLYENTNISSDGTYTAKVGDNNYAEFKNGKEGTDVRGTCTFKIPVITPTPESGLDKLKITLQASDGKSSRDKTLNINFDKLQPVLSTEEFNIGENVVQSNSFYTFGAKVTEKPITGYDQSGLNFIAAYFVRNGQLYNPMLLKDNNTTTIKGNLTLDSGIYWYTYENVTLDGYTLTSTGIGNNKNIHVNGLVKYDGVVYKITGVNTDSVTLNNKPKKTGTTKAYFANALVIDNPVQEMGDSAKGMKEDGSGYYNEVMNDDGDGMVEVAKHKDATWTWSASVNSKNIPDGAIEIHYVAFDNAGNVSIGDTVNGFVRNNRPRIAGFKFQENGKDVNNVCSITSEDNYKKYITSVPNVENPAENEFNWDKTVNDKAKKNPLPTDPIFGDSSAPVAVLGDKTVITPEIVGGNGTIYFKYEIGEGSEQWSGINPSAVVTTIADNYKVNTVANPITLQKGDLYTVGGKFGNASTEGIPFKFTFADSTWSATPYTQSDVGSTGTITNSRFENTDSQKASMTIYFQLKGVGGAPTATIDPFYWKSRIENSLFKNSSEEGHIELGADWEKAPGYTDESLDAKLKDLDDKVSGKIKIEGNVSDDAGLASITFKLGNSGATVEVADIHAYDESAATTSLSTNHYYIYYKSEPKKAGSDIQSLDYVLVWDTSNVNTNMVGLDQAITIKATNKGIPKMSPSTDGTGPLSIDGKTHYGDVQYTGEGKTSVTIDKVNKIKVDVVPYITSFKKSGNANYPRTKSGAYSLARNDSGLVFGGLNIPDNASVNIVTKSKNKIAVTVTNGICTIPSDATSGDFVASVNIGTETENWIPAINSINNNDAEYNRESSGLDSIFNIISYPDDKYVHVWQVSDNDIFEGSKNCFIPTMAKDPVTGQLYAAFSNGGYGSVFTSSKLTSLSKLNEATADNTKGTSGATKPATTLTDVKRIYSYNFPASNIDISVTRNRLPDNKDKDSSPVDVSVSYGAVYRDSMDSVWINPENNYKLFSSGGVYLYDSNRDGDENASVLPLTGTGDKAYRAFRTQLYCYDQNVDQFKNMRVARNGDFIFSAYFDHKNKSVNFTAVRASVNGAIDKNSMGSPWASNSQAFAQDQAYPWISIDGGKIKNTIKNGGFLISNKGYFSPVTRQGFNNSSYTIEVGVPFNLAGNDRIKTAGEYLGLAVTKNGNPLIVYTDNGSDKGGIKIAHSTDASGTLGYFRESNGKTIWTEDINKPITEKCPDTITSFDMDGTKRSEKWTRQLLSTDKTNKFGTPTGYIECAIDSENYLHIVYKTLTGYLVYIKSSSPITEGSPIEFNNDPLLVDKGGSNISIDVDDTCTPYISYIGTADSTDGMKIAIPNTRKDDNPATLDDFETMCAPSNVLVKDNKTCIQTNALDHANAKYKAAVGVYNGQNYRAMYYVGEETTTENQNTEPQTPTDGSVTN